MIVDRRIFNHDGKLVYDFEKHSSGIFIYYDKGSGDDVLKPYEKIRLVEVSYVRSLDRWYFGRFLVKGKNRIAGRTWHIVGIPTVLIHEVIVAILQLCAAHGITKDIDHPTANTITVSSDDKLITVEVPPVISSKQLEEEDEIDLLIEKYKQPKGQKR